MQHAAHAGAARLGHHGLGICLGLASVNDDRFGQITGERELRGEATSLLVSGRVVIVVIEPALADGDGALRDESGDLLGIAERIEATRVVRMNACRKKHDTRILDGNLPCAPGGSKRFANADDRSRTCFARTVESGLAIDVEGGIRQVGVAVDKREH
jgi:hypothetical protein